MQGEDERNGRIGVEEEKRMGEREWIEFEERRFAYGFGGWTLLS